MFFLCQNGIVGFQIIPGNRYVSYETNKQNIKNEQNNAAAPK